MKNALMWGERMRMTELRRLATAMILALSVMLGASVSAQPPAPSAPQPPGYTMPFTHVWDMPADDGQIYRIFVSYPGSGEPPERGYPVLYVLDGNAMFATFANARRLQEYGDLGDSIIVGVGYPTEDLYDIRRFDDLTMKLLDPPPPHLRDFAKYKSGGREAFLDFLTNKLRREIAGRYKIDLDRQSLFGHSFGGLFGLYALYNRPEAFYSIVAASPSLEWNEQAILSEERVFVERLRSGKVPKTSRLMLLIGGRDTDDDPEPAEALNRRLDQLSGYGLRVRIKRYEEEAHMDVPVRAVPDALRFIFAAYF